MVGGHRKYKQSQIPELTDPFEVVEIFHAHLDHVVDYVSGVYLNDNER